MHNEKIQHLAVKIKNTYNKIKSCDRYNISQHEKWVQIYDKLVDEIVELTKGKANAFYTDPILCDDYTSLTEHPCSYSTYNELCERYGALTFGE